jgi:hypothetical protein
VPADRGWSEEATDRADRPRGDAQPVDVFVIGRLPDQDALGDQKVGDAREPDYPAKPDQGVTAPEADCDQGKDASSTVDIRSAV